MTTVSLIGRLVDRGLGAICRRKVVFCKKIEQMGKFFNVVADVSRDAFVQHGKTHHKKHVAHW